MRTHSAMALMAFRCQRRCQRPAASSQLSTDAQHPASSSSLSSYQLKPSLQPINA